MHIHGITDHPQPSRRVLDSYRRVRALHGQPGDVDADAPLPRGGHLQGGEPGIEVLEATHAQPPVGVVARDLEARDRERRPQRDRKSTRLNSSHTVISYAVFCLKKKKKKTKSKQTETHNKDTNQHTNN